MRVLRQWRMVMDVGEDSDLFSYDAVHKMFLYKLHYIFF